ncbi:MAG TPA: hypothetical protein PLU75_04120 [Oscillospiraceae bacterium]|nr:hypothetical protein [Oscillospiraceae bacterium]HQQ89862.1 hypothetical protein [Oscillospiraceae bacterium]HRW56726.1 hypothetical protein [Oscillospiraceae bacterium]
MKNFFLKLRALPVRKKGLLLLTAGMFCLAVSLVLLIATESVMSTVLLYISLILNIIGLYILMWVRERRNENDGK